MTSLDKIERAPLVAAPQNHLTAELTETIRLSAPMALTQLGQIAMMSTDLAFIGRLGDDAVAAAALAGTVYFVSFTFGMGLMSAVSPLAPPDFGGGRTTLYPGPPGPRPWGAPAVELPGTGVR